MLTLKDITEGRALLERAKAQAPGAAQELGKWFEAWGGLVFDMFERIHTPPPDPKRRFCPECGNRSFWPHTSWCSERGRGPGDAPPEPPPTGQQQPNDRELESLRRVVAAAREMRSWYAAQMSPDGPEVEFDLAVAGLDALDPLSNALAAEDEWIG